jgi:hypothetical protein
MIPICYLKHDVSETGFCLRLSIGSKWVGSESSLRNIVLNKRQDDR